MRSGTAHKIERVKQARSKPGLQARKIAGDELKKSELERLTNFPHAVFRFNPKQFLDQLPTALILDYLRLYRNQRI